MLFIIVGVVLVLVIGGAAAFFMMGGKGKKGDDHAEEKAEAKAPTFVVIEPSWSTCSRKTATSICKWQ
jgi:flagellar FliL protein